jgi:uncharacterized protein (UPF0276 family)
LTAHSVPKGVGLGYRTELAADILTHVHDVDFVEVVAEALLSSRGARREACALAEVLPVIPHGVKLSLGSADGVDVERVRRLAALASELHSPLISEHAAFTRAGSHEVGHLTHLPYTRESLDVLERNIAVTCRHLQGIPLFIENAAANFEWRMPQLDEGSFYVELLERTQVPMLLDVANLYANAVNLGLDPVNVALSFPLSRVEMIHMGGGVLEDGFYYDTHAHDVPDAVFELLRVVLEHTGPVPVLLERDADFPPFGSLLGELDRVRTLQGSAKNAPHSAPRPSEIPSGGPLLDQQLRMAAALTQRQAPADISLQRARAVLLRKRVDDALPLLPHLAARSTEVKALALGVVEGRDRTAQRNAFHDAWAIARAAADVETLASDARRDVLLMRARVVTQDMKPRVAPFLGHQSLPDGSAVWSFKGLGADAAVRLFSTRWGG